MPDDKPFINLDDIDFGHTIRGHQKGDRVFERFVLKRLLGRGGMGVVWLATDERLGREVALKFAPEVVRFDDMAIDELKEETRKGLNLAHPNIVKIYDFLLDEDHAAISMEFIDGENLGALRTRQPGKVFEPHQLAHWVDQLLHALDYAHRVAKVIHRDLKPANLMIDREGNLRVTDFGIARSISDAMNRATMGGGNSTGTLAYMSPQQADGKKPHVTDDIYAFGSTVYELLTGKPPFYSGNIAQQLRDEPVISLSERRREFDIISADALPEEWEQTILECLEKDAEKRPPGSVHIRQKLGLAFGPSPAGEGSGSITGFPSTHGIGEFPTPPRSSHHSSLKPKTGMVEMPTVGRSATSTKPATAGVPTTTGEIPQKKSSLGLIIAVVLIFLMLTFVGSAAWWVSSHPEAVKGLLAKIGLPAGPAPSVVSTLPAVTTPTPDSSKKPDLTPDSKPAEPPKTKSIQEAINNAKAGDTIVIPSGTYEEQLRFKEGITLKAEEPGKVIVQTEGSVGAALLVEGCASGTISGFIFQHSGSDVIEKVSWPVVLLKLSSVTFEDCTVISGVGDGMLVTGASKPQLLRSTFKNNARNGLVLESGTTGRIVNCEVRKNGESGVEVRLLGTAPTFEQCILADNGGSGIVVKDGASATISGKSLFQNNREAGVAASGERASVTVEDCTSEDNLAGFSILQNAKGRLVNCTVRNCKEIGMHFDGAGEGSEIQNNTIERCKVAGIFATGVSGSSLSITNNKIKGNAGSGIIVYGAGFKPRVMGNTSSTNAEYGIYAAEGVSGVIQDNTVRGNHLGGIGNVGAALDLLVQGNITDEGR